MDSNNVTLRRQRLVKTKSCEGLHRSSFDTTTSDDFLGTSFDNSMLSHTANPYMIAELKTELQELKTNLECTQSELENVKIIT